MLHLVHVSPQSCFEILNALLSLLPACLNLTNHRIPASLHLKLRPKLLLQILINLPQSFHPFILLLEVVFVFLINLSQLLILFSKFLSLHHLQLGHVLLLTHLLLQLDHLPHIRLLHSPQLLLLLRLMPLNLLLQSLQFSFQPYILTQLAIQFYFILIGWIVHFWRGRRQIHGRVQ
jgi:hypothetical protein